MYRYGDLESMLAMAHGIGPEHVSVFRARLKYYRRLGMFGDVKGERNVVYSFKDLLLWSFMIDVAQFGIDPQRMVQIAWGIWPLCEAAVIDEESHTREDLFFVALPVVLTASILEDAKSFAEKVSGLTVIERGEIRWTYQRSEIPDHVAARAMLINLSSLYRRASKAAATLLSQG